MTAPFPASGDYIRSIRDSSRCLRRGSNISIKPESIKRLLLSPAFTGSFKRVSASHGLALPLLFPSVLAELNLIAILSILNFASGYRSQLHAATGRGAWDSVRAFVFSLYLASAGDEGDFLSARGMQAIGDQKVAELMGVNLFAERPHETIPGLVVGEMGGPLYDLVKLVTATLNETGEVLVNMGYPNLGSFVVEALKEGEKVRSDSNSSADVDAVVERLVRAFPAFRDMALVHGQPVYCFKKALFLINAVGIRFGPTSPPPFPIPSTSNIPIFADNVIPSLLIHLGVIDLSDSSPPLAHHFPKSGSNDMLTSLLASPPSVSMSNQKAVPKDGPVLTPDEAYILRAAAIDACELIVESLHTSTSPSDPLWVKDITLPELDMWIWSIAKDRFDYRALDRFVLRDTVFF